MNVKLTLNTETLRILKGISLNQIYEVLQNGVKSIDRNSIISKHRNLILCYDKKFDSILVKKVMTK